MWTASLCGDSRRTCFITVPQKWGINFSQLPIVKFQQFNSAPIFATCIGDSGPLGKDEVFIGSQFARANNIDLEKEAVFQVVSLNNTAILSSAIAEPTSQDDWELLELNADQVQSQLMNRVRAVWVGAKIPLWLSEFVKLTITIVEFEPKCVVGLLATDTEIHVSPPKPSPRSGPVMDQKPKTIKEVIAQLLHQYEPKPIPPPQSSNSVPIKLTPRVLTIEDELYRSLVDEGKREWLLQPYSAIMSENDCPTPNKTDGYIGRIEHDQRVSHFSIIFSKGSREWPIFSNAIYLTSTITRQLQLNLKQRVEVTLEIDTSTDPCDNLTFYTFVQDYELKELEKDVKMWLPSVAKCDTKLLLNHGQHLDIPCLIKNKTNRLFVGISHKKTDVQYCKIGEDEVAKLLEKIKIIRVNSRNAPKFLQILYDSDDLMLDHYHNLGRIGGMECLLREMLAVLKVGIGLTNNRLSDSFSGCRNGNVLLTGPRGSGRTSIARYLCKQLELGPYYTNTVVVDCSSLKGKQVETLHRDWHAMFQQLIERQPSVLVFDDLDHLASCPQNEQDDSLQGESWYYRRISDLVLELINSTPLANQVMIIATALSAKALHPRLNHYQSTHIFTNEFVIPILSNETRVQVMQAALENQGFVVENEINLAGLAPKMDGCVALDVRQLMVKAAHLAASETESSTEKIVVGSRHLEAAMQDHIPFGLYGINLKPPSDSKVAWSDVGGLADTKKILEETLKWPTQYPELFAHSPIRLRSAILLYGAPGTGKTMLARAVATECGVNFISIKGPELLSKYIGASEESVRETFRRARSAKPCILFFDEFDSLAPRRGHDSTGVTDRVVNQLLTELDGVEGQESGLWILAATSRPDLIDPALLRPGRFDLSVRCSLPDKDDRLEILKALSSRLQLDEDVRLDDIVAQSEHFTGADLQAVLYTAQLKAVTQLTLTGGEPCPVIRITHQLLVNALQETRPSVSPSERKRYERIYENFSGSGPNGGRQPTATEDGVGQQQHQRVTLA